MNLRRKLITLTIAATVLAASVVACGSSDTNQNKENGTQGSIHTASFCNIDTDTLPYNEESIYQQLFDINNKVAVELDVTEETYAIDNVGIRMKGNTPVPIFTMWTGYLA